jgi:hypothetical protein
MINMFKYFSFQFLFKDSTLAVFYMLLLCMQFVPIEGDSISIVKVVCMALSPIAWLLKGGGINESFFWGVAYWLSCFICSLFQYGFRFATLIYLGLFIFTYILFLFLLQKESLNLNDFTNLLRVIIISYCVILVSQQVCLLFGIRNFPLINLCSQGFLDIAKLPSLSLEPSHTAIIISVSMLAYLRCVSMDVGYDISIKELFRGTHRIVSLSYLWMIFTMGSGTGFVGLAIISLFFIQRKTIIWTLPLIVGLFFLGRSLEIKQVNRVVNLLEIGIETKNIQKMKDVEGSGAYRIIPLINTVIKMDYAKSDTWFGTGIQTREHVFDGWKRTTDKLIIIEQYGLLSFLFSIMLVYRCGIKKILSIETLLFLVLFNFSLVNIYFVWGCFMIMSAVCFFQRKIERGMMNI